MTISEQQLELAEVTRDFVKGLLEDYETKIDNKVRPVMARSLGLTKASRFASDINGVYVYIKGEFEKLYTDYRNEKNPHIALFLSIADNALQVYSTCLKNLKKAMEDHSNELKDPNRSNALVITFMDSALKETKTQIEQVDKYWEKLQTAYQNQTNQPEL